MLLCLTSLLNHYALIHSRKFIQHSKGFLVERTPIESFFYFCYCLHIFADRKCERFTEERKFY